MPSVPESRPSTAGPAPVLFVHIPKTAGTALFAIAASIHGRIPGLIDPRIFLIPLDWNGPDDDPATVAAVRRRTPGSLRYSSGHCSIRFRDHLPADTRVITMLRDPVKRVLSAYANMRRDSGNGYHQIASRSTLEEILEARSLPELDNGQVRRLAGVQPDAGPTDRSHLDLAIQNVDEEFTAVGFTERFDES
ncbi:MAG: sulfotransferase family protein, partial [Phycisphaeraceae bacterium]|nr:sulfotransferase family protein [Phycisphaeraceae bacterium]